MEIRELKEEEMGSALALAWTVFQQYEAPDYADEGVKAFYASIHDPAYTAALRIYGAFEGEQLIGMLATRNGGAHIALFFVDGAFQRQGVGKRLFAFTCSGNPAATLTVNASPYAVEIYRRLGFRPTALEQVTNGIRYTPMECRLKDPACPCKRTRCPRHGDCLSCREHHHGDKRATVSCERPAKRERRTQSR